MDTDPHEAFSLAMSCTMVTSTPEPGCDITTYRQDASSVDDVILDSCDSKEAFNSLPHDLTVLKKEDCYLHNLLIDYYLLGTGLLSWPVYDKSELTPIKYVSLNLVESILLDIFILILEKVG